LSGVIGSVRTRFPVALNTAFAIAADAPHSPSAGERGRCEDRAVLPRGGGLPVRRILLRVARAPEREGVDLEATSQLVDGHSSAKLPLASPGARMNVGVPMSSRTIRWRLSMFGEA
jgi:hypothetical protein